MRALPLLLLVAVALGAGCVQYNDPCTVVADADEPAGYLGHPVFLDKPHARHANNAIGQMAADAFRAPTSAELGVINGGGIRAEGLCVTRTVVREVLTRGALHEILLFDNRVITLDLTAEELIRVFVNAVSGLTRYGQPIGSGPGNFLHVSEGTKLEINCLEAPGAIPGRVKKLEIGGRVLVGSGSAVNADAVFRVAITDFLINFGGGTSDILHGLDSDPTRNPIRGGIDSDLAEDYMGQRYGTPEAPLRVDEVNRIVFLDDPLAPGTPSCARP